MRSTERLRKLKEWCYNELCKGREMKQPGANMNIADVQYREPQVYLAWSPSRMDQTGQIYDDAISVVPGIIIMPNHAYSKYTEEKRFDRYNNIHRSQEMGQHLVVDILFCVYEPGVREPGFSTIAGDRGQNVDMSLIHEGTEQGLFTLLNWMDDCQEKLLGQKMIPDTDLFVEESTMTYSLYTDQSYVVDRRPIYYGFVHVSFGCYADEGVNRDINNLLL